MRVFDQKAEKKKLLVQTPFGPSLPIEVMWSCRDGEQAHGGPPGPLWGDGLVRSGHRYSPTGRSSGRLTADMLDSNIGAVLAATAGTQGAGTSGHLWKD